ncbi:WecB/TagA/CpsF family glycosyltransferase [Parvularcula lutaonensis]|uniref:WecB/TagA/CpsF family glycosyltransferase n=1 Tax=Parvularcula lutaonensis TaxID=491923 RepID=A0ABV7MCT4_9PROT|nr:WecB/TagA/CpsF family glycosyltransferase [Parvularcula lutaonensis]GGY51632.1 UDP-N-acetyl-D-mannosaminuronic acid transferase [Parvularcula lutaonensis]
MTDRKTTELLGIPFDHLSGEAICERIAEAAARKDRLWISTANLDWVVLARANEDFRRTLMNSDLVTCDGAPVMILSRLAGKPLPHRVTGVEIFERLMAGEGGALRIGFFGAENDEAVRASEALNRSETPLIGAGGYNPGHGSVDDLSADRHIEALNAMEADMLVLALGAVKAQAWIERNLDRLNAPVLAHLGAVVRHVSGDTVPAPKILSRTGFEWAYRAVKEPAVRSRYLSNFAALPGLTLAALGERRDA